MAFEDMCVAQMKKFTKRLHLSQVPVTLAVENTTVTVLGRNRSATVTKFARLLAGKIGLFTEARPSKLVLYVRVVDGAVQVHAEIPTEEVLPLEEHLAAAIKLALEKSKNNLKFDFELDVDKGVYINWRAYCGLPKNLFEIIQLAHTTAEKYRTEHLDASANLKFSVRGRSVAVLSFPNVPAAQPERTILKDPADSALFGYDVGGFVTCVTAKSHVLVLPEEVVETPMPEHLSNTSQFRPDEFWIACEFMAYCTDTPDCCDACRTLVVTNSTPQDFGKIVIHQNRVVGFFVLSSRTLCVVYGDGDEATIILVDPKKWGGSFFTIKDKARVVMAAGFDTTVYLLLSDSKVLVVEVGAEEVLIAGEFDCKHPNRSWEEPLSIAVSSSEVCVGTASGVLLFDRATGDFKKHASASYPTSLCAMKGGDWAVINSNRIEKWRF